MTDWAPGKQFRRKLSNLEGKFLNYIEIRNDIDIVCRRTLVSLRVLLAIITLNSLQMANLRVESRFIYWIICIKSNIRIFGPNRDFRISSLSPILLWNQSCMCTQFLFTPRRFKIFSIPIRFSRSVCSYISKNSEFVTKFKEQSDFTTFLSFSQFFDLFDKFF